MNFPESASCHVLPVFDKFAEPGNGAEMKGNGSFNMDAMPNRLDWILDCTARCVCVCVCMWCMYEFQLMLNHNDFRCILARLFCKSLWMLSSQCVCMCVHVQFQCFYITMTVIIFHLNFTLRNATSIRRHWRGCAFPSTPVSHLSVAGSALSVQHFPYYKSHLGHNTRGKLCEPFVCILKFNCVHSEWEWNISMADNREAAAWRERHEVAQPLCVRIRFRPVASVQVSRAPKTNELKME